MKMTRLTQHRLLLVLTASLLLILSFMFLRVNLNDPISLFYSQDLIWLVLGGIFWWLLFNTVYNAKIIVKPKSNRDEKPPNNNIKGKNQIRYKGVCIKKMLPLISAILSLTFVAWFLIIFVVAGMNQDKVVINHFNVYGEYMFEFGFVVLLTVVILVGLYFNYKRTTKDIDELRKSKLQ